MSEDKRVEVMLLRLEEAISAGQFDKAAVLAKELAAIKRTPSPVSPAPPSKPIEVLPAIIPKPVAAPRSVVPVVVAQQQSEPVKTSAEPIANPVITAPLPAKRLSHLSSPSPLPRKSIRPEEKEDETVKPLEAKKEEKSIMIKEPSPEIQPEEPAQVIAEPLETTSAVVVRKPNNPTPEVTVRTKRRSVKVSSGQQTTLTYQKKSSANVEENNQRRTQSCIVDDTFKYSFHLLY